MRSIPLLLVWLACAGVCGCGPRVEAQPVAVQARPVPLDPDAPARERLGALVYAGGVALTSPSFRFGGLSGLDVLADGRFISQTDQGDLLTGRIVLDAAGRLQGVADAEVRPLIDPSARPYRLKTAADAEDITWLPNGGYAVSFERRHRVQAYDLDGKARPLGVPVEAFDFEENRGLEALAAWTDAAGRQRLAEGAEDGRIWSCDLEGLGCEQIVDASPEAGFSLTGLDEIPDGRGLVAVYRAFDLIRGMRALVAWLPREAPGKPVVLARLSAPTTVDNMEGIAAVANTDGSVRIYLMSDDNFLSIQRTLLLAFDWRAEPQATPEGRK